MSKPFFRALLLALGLASTAALTPALAQSYPAKAVRIIVPFAAGGPADVYARFMAQRLQDALGQSFVVDNRPGAGSVIGTDAAAKSAPDGYTLLLMSNAHTVNETLIANKPFQLMRDFVAVAPINYSDLVLVATPALPDSTLKALIADAKARPGKLNYASSGPGTPASCKVGTSGNTSERCLPVVASALTLPALTCSAMVVTASNITSTWPPMTSVRAPLLPR